MKPSRGYGAPLEFAHCDDVERTSVQEVLPYFAIGQSRLRENNEKMLGVMEPCSFFGHQRVIEPNHDKMELLSSASVIDQKSSIH